MVHEVLAYKAFPPPGFRTAHGYAFVRVNGAAYGVYLNVESLDDVSLPRLFPPPRISTRAGYGTDVSPGRGRLRGGRGLRVRSRRPRGADIGATTAEATGPSAWARWRTWRRWPGCGRSRGTSATGTPTPAGRAPTGPTTSTCTATRRAASRCCRGAPTRPGGCGAPFDGDGGQLFDACLSDTSCLEMYRQAVTDGEGEDRGAGPERRGPVAGRDARAVAGAGSPQGVDDAAEIAAGVEGCPGLHRGPAGGRGNVAEPVPRRRSTQGPGPRPAIARPAGRPRPAAAGVAIERASSRSGLRHRAAARRPARAGSGCGGPRGSGRDRHTACTAKAARAPQARSRCAAGSEPRPRRLLASARCASG